MGQVTVEGRIFTVKSGSISHRVLLLTAGSVNLLIADLWLSWQGKQVTWLQELEGRLEAADLHTAGTECKGSARGMGQAVSSTEGSSVEVSGERHRGQV